MPCHSSCYTCDGSGSDDCTSCAGGTYLKATTGTCVNVCPDGTYKYTHDDDDDDS
jgi:hypothetical protein